jgi:hypothetical protein
MNCQVVCTINQVLGNSAIGLASLNLALRTMAIWEWGRRISIPIGILIMASKQHLCAVSLFVNRLRSQGHWFILLHGVLITAEWTPGAGCAIVKTQNKILAAGCLYTMLLDAVVLGFTLIRIRPGDERPLAKLIVSDGVRSLRYNLFLHSTLIADSWPTSLLHFLQTPLPAGLC